MIILNKNSINLVRYKFCENSSNETKGFDEIDFYKILIDDWIIEKFILSESNYEIDKSLKSLEKTLEFLKTFEVYKMNDSIVPKEFHQIYDREIYGRDKHGRLIFWTIFKEDRPRISDKTKILLKRSMVYYCEKYDKLAHRNGMIIISTLPKSNIDFPMELIKFGLQLTKHFPFLNRHSYYVKPPKSNRNYLNIFLFILKKCVSIFQLNINIVDQMSLIEQNILPEIIDSQIIPIEFGGQRKRNFGE